jgi:hypothetical protein
VDISKNNVRPTTDTGRNRPTPKVTTKHDDPDDQLDFSKPDLGLPTNDDQTPIEHEEDPLR